MPIEPSTPVVDFGTVRLHRAMKRLREQDRAGALADMRAALAYMHQARAPLIYVRQLAEMQAWLKKNGG